MTTIGTAVLQIIPSLLGVSEAIEKQIDGKTVDIQIKPKVDQRAAETAAKQTRETIEKETTEVKVEPKVDAQAAEQAGRTAGEAVTKGATDAVQESSPGRDLAKVLVDGIADGVKDELRGGPLVDEFVDGLADGVKQGIDQGGVSRTILSSISDGLKSGNIGGTIRDAVLPTIRDLGTDLRSSTADWGRGIADSLRSGDIQGATDSLGNTVRTTTDLIANIGDTFGLQTGGVREFAENAVSSLSDVGGGIQGSISKALELKGTFDDIGSVLEKALPDKADKAAAGISAALNRVVLPVWLTALLGNEIANKIDDALPGEDHPDRSPGWAIERGFTAPKRIWESITGQRDPNTGELKQDIPKGLPFGTGNGPHGRGPVKDPTGGLLTPGAAPSTSGDSAKDLLEKLIPGKSSGGYTGNLPIDKVAGVVHGGEWVINALSTSKIQSAAPGLLEALNGYQGGGLVAGTSQLRKIIGEKFGISDIGGWRPQDKYGEHSTGRALDVMVGNNRAKGDAVKDFALANASAIDLKWVIWRQHLYYPGGGGYDMENRGSPTANHMDHVHIFSGTGIANGLRGALQRSRSGSGPSPLAAAVSTAPGAIDPASSDQTGSAADVAPASSSGSGGGVSLASSISGLAGMGLSDLGSGVGKTSTGSDLSLFGNAASSAVSGQVSSALGVLGVPDSPGWLQGISKFVGGLSISDKSGNKIFGGGSGASAFGSAGSLFGGAAPATPPAPTAAALPGGAVHGGNGQRLPGPPGPTYHIRTATVEDAFVQAQHQEKVRLASKLDRF